MTGQTIAVVVILLVAAGYLAIRTLRKRRKGACGCEHCPAQDSK